MDTRKERNQVALSVAPRQDKSWEDLTCLLPTLTGKTELLAGSGCPLASGCPWLSLDYRLALAVPRLQADSGCPSNCRLAQGVPQLLAGSGKKLLDSLL